MKIPLLLIGFFWLTQHANAQIGVHAIYNPSPLLSSKNSSLQKKNRALADVRPYIIFLKGQLIFSQYLPRPKVYRSLLMADNSLAALNPKRIREIDLEQSRNHSTQLFYKMKMWRYFR